MKRVLLDSSSVAAVTYEESKHTLDIEFREGKTYRYFHIPELVCRGLLRAESAGAFWNSVKDQYEFVLLKI